MIIRKKTEANISASTTSKKIVKRYVKAAEDDFEDFDDIEDGDGIIDAIDDVADNVEDLQDAVDDVKEDQVEIAVNNNIADHFIAECERCGGVFISAVVDSDQRIDHVSGVCPLCGRETEQYLKWIIKSAE